MPITGPTVESTTIAGHDKRQHDCPFLCARPLPDLDYHPGHTAESRLVRLFYPLRPHIGPATHIIVVEERIYCIPRAMSRQYWLNPTERSGTY